MRRLNLLHPEKTVKCLNKTIIHYPQAFSKGFPLFIGKTGNFARFFAVLTGVFVTVLPWVCLFDDFVDETVFHRFLCREEIVSFGVILDIRLLLS